MTGLTHRVGAAGLAIPAMAGMRGGPRDVNPVVVSAFHTTLLRQGLVVGAIAAAVLVAWNLARRMQLRRPPAAVAPRFAGPEAPARRFLRVSFGLLWILDGTLQGQGSMPLGMVPQVIRPAAASSPVWVRHLVASAGTIWSFHPISAAAATVWIQIGLGVWLLVAPRGAWSRLAGQASLGWGLVVWVFGEAFGGIFAPGVTVLFGAPGAALFYCIAGGLIALPERSWSAPRLGRVLLGVIGLFLAGLAVLQAWPNRGFWQGQASGAVKPGELAAMVRQMSQTSQPGWLASWVRAFGSFDAAHGWGVNLFAVIALAGIGVALLSGRRPLVAGAVVIGVPACLVDWVLVEDLGFLGGLGTDPNSMIPLALLVVGGYLAVARVPAAVSAPLASSVEDENRVSWREQVSLDPAYGFRCAAALGAIAIIAVGVAPMALVATSSHAARLPSPPAVVAGLDWPVTQGGHTHSA